MVMGPGTTVNPADGTPRLGRVPRSRSDAAAVCLVLALVLVVLFATLRYTVGHALTLEPAGQVGAAAIAGGIILTILLYGMALLTYALPTFLGVRRPARGPPGAP